MSKIREQFEAWFRETEPNEKFGKEDLFEAYEEGHDSARAEARQQIQDIFTYWLNMTAESETPPDPEEDSGTKIDPSMVDHTRHSLYRDKPPEPKVVAEDGPRGDDMMPGDVAKEN